MIFFKDRVLFLSVVEIAQCLIIDVHNGRIERELVLIELDHAAEPAWRKSGAVVRLVVVVTLSRHAI